jgi:hypothetical protein
MNMFSSSLGNLERGLVLSDKVNYQDLYDSVIVVPFIIVFRHFITGM